MSEPAFDELLRRLAEAKAEFVVVGGLAVNAWGVVRGTKDVDVVVAPEIDNLKRVAEVTVEAGGRVQKGEALLGGAIAIASALASGGLFVTGVNQLERRASAAWWPLRPGCLSRRTKPLGVGARLLNSSRTT